jgi:hypothetical protein
VRRDGCRLLDGTPAVSTSGCGVATTPPGHNKLTEVGDVQSSERRLGDFVNSGFFDSRLISAFRRCHSHGPTSGSEMRIANRSTLSSFLDWRLIRCRPMDRVQRSG